MPGMRHVWGQASREGGPRMHDLRLPLDLRRRRAQQSGMRISSPSRAYFPIPGHFWPVGTVFSLYRVEAQPNRPHPNEDRNR